MFWWYSRLALLMYERRLVDLFCVSLLRSCWRKTFLKSIDCVFESGAENLSENIPIVRIEFFCNEKMNPTADNFFIA